MSEELDEAFLDYMSYLVFMAAQLPWGYGSFALVKGLGKVLEMKALSGELGHDDLCARLNSRPSTGRRHPRRRPGLASSTGSPPSSPRR